MAILNDVLVGDRLRLRYDDGEDTEVEVREVGTTQVLVCVTATHSVGSTNWALGSERLLKIKPQAGRRIVVLSRADEDDEDENDEEEEEVSATYTQTEPNCAICGRPASEHGKPFNSQSISRFSINFNHEEKPMLRKLSQALKKLFSASLKVQYEAGFLNDDATLTSKGLSELFDILKEKNQEELTARAKEIVAELKADNE